MKVSGNIYRLKGFVFSEDDPDHRILVQVVEKRIDIARDYAWGGQKPEIKLVAIGASGALTEHTLTGTLLEIAWRLIY